MYTPYSSPQPAAKKGSVLKTFFAFLTAVALCLPLMVSCGDSSTDSGTNGQNGNGNGNDEPGENEVWMSGASFSPSTLQIETGTTVTWINRDTQVHTVTSGTGGEHDGLFDSGSIPAEGTYTYTFNNAGTFNYYCIPHVGMGMTGQIIVSGESTGNGGGSGGGDNSGDGGGDSGY